MSDACKPDGDVEAGTHPESVSSRLVGADRGIGLVARADAIGGASDEDRRLIQADGASICWWTAVVSLAITCKTTERRASMRLGTTISSGILGAALLAAGPAAAQSANAVLINPDGEEIGNVALEQLERGRADLRPGRAACRPGDARASTSTRPASCDPPDFQSAGGHFNPTEEQHGWNNPQGHHAGDLPNVHVQRGRPAGGRVLHRCGDARRGRDLGLRRRRLGDRACTRAPTTTRPIRPATPARGSPAA